MIIKMRLNTWQGNCDVLIVDDNTELVDMVISYLSSKGFIAYGLTSSTDYMSDIREAHPRVVLLDVSIPGANGYELCSRIKKDPELKNAKVVFFTANPLAEVIQSNTISGSDGYILKPFTIPDLNRTVKSFLE